MLNLLFRMFLSTSSSAVGRMLSRRIKRAPIASFDSDCSFSACSLKMLRLISSAGVGRSASFSDKLSLRAILAARSVPGGSSRYNIGPSLESLSSSSSFDPPAEPLALPYGRAFSLFSIVQGKPNLIGRELQSEFTSLSIRLKVFSTNSS